MDENNEQKTKIRNLRSDRDALIVLLELRKEYERIMGKKARSYDTDNGMVPAGRHLNYINA